MKQSIDATAEYAAHEAQQPPGSQARMRRFRHHLLQAGDS